MWLALLTWLSGCDAPAACEVASTVADYTPSCDGLLVLFPEETRLVIDERIEVWLPADVQTETVYGGRTGNGATITLDGELADSNQSTVTFGGRLQEVRLSASFAAGEVEGALEVVVEREP